ncbi:hypothetical protein [Cohaesibacter celericrescens]|uniref:hypothetical protein n=1 Tax=Cohaesibacter celericrescens TaxID=2067669 RepID=UPI0015E0A28F|nr:hypothetical protein [Cohaesibacter celericrescens]
MIHSLLFLIFLACAPASAAPVEPTGVGMELLMVEAEGCVWCARWNKEIGPIYPKSSEGKRAPLRRIDKQTSLPSSFKLTRGFFYTPTFILLVDGTEKGRIEGYPGEDFFWGLLAQLLASVDKSASVELERQQDNNAR